MIRPVPTATVGYPMRSVVADFSETRLCSPIEVRIARNGHAVSVRYDNGGLYTFKPLTAEQRVRRDKRRVQAVFTRPSSSTRLMDALGFVE